jgi:hypothetical protein
LAAAAAQAGNNNKSATTRKEVDGKSKEKEDKDNTNDFFSKFKKTTWGKNFQLGWALGRLCVLTGSLRDVLLISSPLYGNRYCIVALNVPAWSIACIGTSTTSINGWHILTIFSIQQFCQWEWGHLHWMQDWW